MDAALEVLLDGGHTLLITDAEDSLSWDREEHQSWGVGLYPPDPANTDGERLAFDSTPDGSPGRPATADRGSRPLVRAAPPRLGAARPTGTGAGRRSGPGR